MSDESFELPAVLAELRARYRTAPPYSRLWRAVVDGRFPAHRDGRTWRVRRGDLPAVARTFSLEAAV